MISRGFNKIVSALLVIVLTFGLVNSIQAESKEEYVKRTQWFNDAKFGMFIHWGVYALLGKGEWIQTVDKIPVEEYEQLYPKFNPVNYDPEEWVRLAEEAGMKYIVITSKHHDGFAIFDSKLTDYDIMSTPYGKDALKMLTDVCHRRGMPIGFYHSILDWHHPDYLPRRPWETETRSSEGADLNRYLEYMKSQLQELLTNYGKLAFIWFDGGWEHTPEELHSEEIVAMIRSMQPHILVNDRARIPADFGTPEQRIPATGIRNPDGTPRLWEACMTMTSHWWGYDKFEKNYKSSEFLIRGLIDIVSKGGNLLLNVGPKPDGTIQTEFVDRLKAIGRWMRVNGEAIYGTAASPFRYLPFFGRCTVKPGKMYLHVFDWPLDRKIRVAGLRNVVTRAHLLNDPDKRLSYARDGSDVIIYVPAQAPDSYASVVVLDIVGSPSVEQFKIKPRAEGVIELPVLYSEIRARHGQRAWFASERNKVYIGNWTNKNDYLIWEFEAPAPGRYDVHLTYGCDHAGGKFSVVIGNDSLTAVTRGRDFKEYIVGSLSASKGKNSLRISALDIPKGAELMRLHKVRLVPFKSKTSVDMAPFPTGFTYSTALAAEPGVTRRDPSDVIKVGSKYYVWYTKVAASNEGYPTGYPGTIWYAASTDGKRWAEQGEALGKGAADSWDEHGIFTPNILAADGKYFLFYTGVPEPFSNDYETATPTAIGLAVSDSPDGPWKRFSSDPILEPGDSGEWDDFRVDDACMIIWDGKYRLYYKGVNHEKKWRGLTSMGVALADEPTGPYIRSQSNPLILSGHEVLVWHHSTGIAALVRNDGVWYSPDGLQFRKYVSMPPDIVPGAAAAYRPGNGITWGICQKYDRKQKLLYLQRFDCTFDGNKLR